MVVDDVSEMYMCRSYIFRSIDGAHAQRWIAIRNKRLDVVAQENSRSLTVYINIFDGLVHYQVRR